MSDYPGHEDEKLVCVRSTGINHVYDFWVEKTESISGLKTYHYVKPRYIEKAMEILLEGSDLQPIDRLKNFKKGDIWKP